METYTEPRTLIANPAFQRQRNDARSGLRPEMIDEPIVDLVSGLNKLPCFFSLQCCYGHFLFESQTDPANTDPLPLNKSIKAVEYRIAYLAFCIENSIPGRELLKRLSDVEALDTEYIQFCSADWFWEQQINSYALQVEPDRFKKSDTAIIEYEEALRVEAIRNRFFEELHKILSRFSGSDPGGIASEGQGRGGLNLASSTAKQQTN